MPKTIQEGDLIFEFPDELDVRKFDDSSHGETRLKAVDFVVETGDTLLLIEVKDPEHSRIPEQHRAEQVERFAQKLAGEPHFRNEIASKLKDSVFYLYLQGQLSDKPLRYVYVTGLSTIDPAQLIEADRRMRLACCVSGPEGGWHRDYFVAFLDLRQWQRQFPHIPVRRAGIA